MPSEFCRGDLPRGGAARPAGRRLRLGHEGPRDRHAAAHERGRGGRGARAARSPCSPGPSFALEVAKGLPTAVVVASRRPRGRREACSGRSPPAPSASTRARTWSASSSAGALKNVIAIAAGIVDGLGYGHNTVAALITRGLAEITRLAVALGGAAGHARRPRRPRRPGADLHRARCRATGRWASASAAACRSPRRAPACTPRACARRSPPARWPSARASRCRSRAQMKAVLYEGKPPREAARRADAAQPEKGVNCPFRRGLVRPAGGSNVPAHLSGRRQPADATTSPRARW